MRVIGVITVFEGTEAVERGYKFLLQDLAFSCKNRRVSPPGKEIGFFGQSQGGPRPGVPAICCITV